MPAPPEFSPPFLSVSVSELLLLGYGKRGSPPEIPPDATLVFDVTYLGLSKG
jgi:hypothetical protein